MNLLRALTLAIVGTVISLSQVLPAIGQIVINELVKEERTTAANDVATDTREFIELYNAGDEPVDLSGWKIVRWDYALDGPGLLDIDIPSGTIQPDDYFVIGGSVVPNVDLVPGGGAGTDLFPDRAGYGLELRDDAGTMVDAVAYELWQATLFPPTAEQAAQIGQGYQGQLFSVNQAVAGPNARESWSRFRDGHDTNNNGHDFGIQPLTPGATNDLPLNASHTVPDVDAIAVGTRLGTQYHSSFVLPTVINPGVVDGNNPRVIPASPQGGRAIVSWDPPGGNSSYSKELVNSFEIYAYFDTEPIGVAATSEDEEWESHIYGIGSTDPIFGNPDPTGVIFVDGFITSNASTGIGWLYQQYEENHPDVEQPAYSKLMLIDFGDGGNSVPEAGEWEILEEIDMSVEASAWYRLGISYDPNTNEVTATFDDQVFIHTLEYDLLGSFFVGYREAITGNPLAQHNPPIWDLFEEEGLTGDYNEDGNVDAADYIVWRKNPGAFGGNQGYTDWATNYGAPGGGGSSALGGAVPEPSSVALVVLGLLAAGSQRRRA